MAALGLLGGEPVWKHACPHPLELPTADVTEFITKAQSDTRATRDIDQQYQARLSALQLDGLTQAAKNFQHCRPVLSLVSQNETFLDKDFDHMVFVFVVKFLDVPHKARSKGTT